MKPRFSNQRNLAMTLIEVLVVILVLAIAVAMTLPARKANRRHQLAEGCKNNLEEIYYAYQSWANDHNGSFPMKISASNGGTMELAADGDAMTTFQILSNELKTPKYLICPADKSHVAATNFSIGFTAKNISYFVGVDASTNYPQAFLSGDDSFVVNNVRVKSGLLEISTNMAADWYKIPVDWAEERHDACGMIGTVDGEVRETYFYSLRDYLHETGLATNRLAIP
jgi:prepilin-type N-terminal cleavage/methylation domain-containing protein